MFVNNKYLKVYMSLVEKAKLSNRKKTKENYFEKHHIIPKSLGGSNNPDNLVWFTCREHFVAHALLAKITTGADRIKMIRALSAMSMKNKRLGTYFNSRLYETYTEIALQDKRDRAQKLWADPEFRKKHAESMSKVRTPEFAEKISATLKSRYKANPELKSEISTSQKSRWQNPEYREAQISKQNSGRETITFEQRSLTAKCLWNDDDYRKKHETRIQNMKEKTGALHASSKQCTDGEEIFGCLGDMAKKYDIHPDNMSKRIRSDKPKWSQFRWT